MRAIYSNAQRVVIWLGEPQNDSELAMESFPSLNQKLRDIHMSDTPFDPSTMFRRGLPPKDHVTWQAIRLLMRHPWFRRLWILQEAALAQHLIVMCGSSWISWYVLVGFIQFIEDLKIAYLIRSEKDSSISNGGYSIRVIEALRSSGITTRTFANVLECGRKQDCSLAVDRVYGLLALMSPYDQQDLSGLKAINYNADYWRIHVDVNEKAV